MKQPVQSHHICVIITHRNLNNLEMSSQTEEILFFRNGRRIELIILWYSSVVWYGIIEWILFALRSISRLEYFLQVIVIWTIEQEYENDDAITYATNFFSTMNLLSYVTINLLLTICGSLLSFNVVIFEHVSLATVS